MRFHAEGDEMPDECSRICSVFRYKKKMLLILFYRCDDA